MLVPNWTLMDCSIAPGSPAEAARWRALSGRSLAPSGHNAPELMAVAFSHWSQGLLATVKDSDGLRLALPLVHRRFPVPFYENWSSPINFFGLPHVDRVTADPALTALLRKASAPLLLRSIPIEGPLWEAMSAAASKIVILRRWERAALRPAGGYAQWFEGNFDRKRRNTLRRLRARLAEQGEFKASSLSAPESATLWASDFLALEGAGWKGRKHTALNSHAMTARAFCAACERLAEAGALRFWKLAVDQRPVAMLFGYADGGQIWLGKIAHDEAFAKYSPGVLLLLHATQQMFTDGVTVADSCAEPDHPLVNHIWRDRIAVADVMLAGSTVSAATFTAAAGAYHVRTRMKRAARAVLDRLTS